jgi:hypothetical protein
MSTIYTTKMSIVTAQYLFLPSFIASSHWMTGVLIAARTQLLFGVYILDVWGRLGRNVDHDWFTHSHSSHTLLGLHV